MLIAYTDQQQLFLPYHYTREALQRYRRQVKFFCPQCLEPVQLKIGHYNIPHFAHLTKNHCDQLFAEGESKLHLQGKIQLFEWLQQLGHTVELEPFLKKLSQRPDLLITVEGNRFAVEFQCSAISHEKWQQRTTGYNKHHIKAIWLFQTPSEKQTINGIHKLKISPLLQKALQPTQEGLPYLITYNAQTAKFIYWTNLLHVQGHTFIGKVQELPIAKQRFPFYEPTCITQQEFQQYWRLYKDACRQFAYGRLLHSRKGVQDPFLRPCYELHLSPSNLPLWIGIPVKEGAAIPLFISEWQIMLLSFSQQLCVEPCALTKNQIAHFLAKHQLEVSERAIKAIQQYGLLLKHIGHKEDLSDICEQVYAHLFAIATIY
ncbi:competence protein CoiA family protein [Lysinibacillus sp. FSL K6-0232]|uniref:competence protein CoiA n=1 Tax=unclassified Lysinibacillus TaxID=2636778 RepID=UPI0030F9FCA3